MRPSAAVIAPPLQSCRPAPQPATGRSRLAVVAVLRASQAGHRCHALGGPDRRTMADGDDLQARGGDPPEVGSAAVGPTIGPADGTAEPTQPGEAASWGSQLAVSWCFAQPCECCVRASMYACMRAGVHTCKRALMCVCVCVEMWVCKHFGPSHFG